VADRLVFGENIADTQRLVETGNADVGVIALSLAIAADERGVGEWVLLDEALHDPLQQDLVVTKTDGDRAERARSFIALVDSERGREVMRRYGFLLPGDEGGGSVIETLGEVDWRPLWLSLRVATLATVLATGAGLTGAFVLARGRFRGRRVLEAIASCRSCCLRPCSASTCWS
jgi:hypothetical protein